MPDAKQRARDALEHLKAFEQGALADVKTELAKVAGLLQGNGDPVPDADEAEDAPAAPPAAPAKPPPGPDMAKATIRSPGKKPVSFNKGGLHKTTGTPQGQKIPPAKMAAAAAGKFGPLGKKQAGMAKGMLAAGRKTAASNRKKG